MDSVSYKFTKDKDVPKKYNIRTVDKITVTKDK